MTIIAGALSRTQGPLPIGLRESLVTNLSRDPEARPHVLGGDRWLLAKVDVGAYGAPAMFGSSEGPAFAMAGEPLLALAANSSFRDRCEEGEAIFRDLGSGSTASLEASTGVFCGAYYEPDSHRLLLVADKLALRPIYYAMLPHAVVFASALRILEEAGIPRGLDLRGTYETCAFGFPLGERTAYENVRTIGAGQVVELGAQTHVVRRYFQWEKRLSSRRKFDQTNAVEDLCVAFRNSVRRRLRGDKHVLSFLSGGLDSRAIVGTLRSLGTRVLTVNFAPSGSQDRHFAELAAGALDAEYHQLEVPFSSVVSAYRQEQMRTWLQSLRNTEKLPERSNMVWSGDGGSVGMGHVYLDEATVGEFERGNTEAGITSFLRFNRLAGAANSALADDFRKRCSTWHFDGLREELATIGELADGRAIYLFLMLNDQRRHLAKHFEKIDIHRFEFQLPFFDSEFLIAVGQYPVAPFLNHKLYHTWLAALCPEAVSVPWQTYPGHEPCPLKAADNLLYQWDRKSYFGKSEERKSARARGREALNFWRSRQFPTDVVHRWRMGVSIVPSLFGSDVWSHIVRVGTTFLRFSSIAAGDRQQVRARDTRRVS